MSLKPRLLGVIAVLAVCGNLPGTRAQQPPTFRSNVQVVEVDVRVSDKDGRAVRGLTANDFVILENGSPQPLTTFSFVDLEQASPVTRGDEGAIFRDVASNEGSGRMWVMLIGGFGQKARLAARSFIQNALGPHDDVAVVMAHGTMSSGQGFTRNRRLLLDAADRIGESPANIGLNPLSIGYRVLEDVSIRLGAFKGRRKAVVYFDPPAYFQPPPSARPDQLVPYFDQLDAVRAATRNNVTVYVVSTLGLSTELGSLYTSDPLTGQTALQQVGGLRLLAEETGGDAIVNSNNYVPGFERFVRDSSVYYLLGYMPSVEQRDGSFQAITVRVNRPGVTVQARRGYYAETPRPTGSSSNAAPSSDIRDALRLPLAIGGLTMDLFAAPFRGAGRQAEVLLGVQLHGRDLLLARGDRLEVGYQAITAEGRVTPGASHELTLNLSEASRGRAETAGVRLVERIALPEGRHQVRFAVHQANGKTGMVVADVDVPDFANDSVSLSGLVLSSDFTAQQTTVSGETAIEARLGIRPSAIRLFSRDDIVTGYAEVYTNARTRIESVRVSATLALVGDTKTREIPVTLSTTEARSAACTLRVPLTGLAAGEYALTLEARSGRRSAVRHVLLTVQR